MKLRSHKNYSIGKGRAEIKRHFKEFQHEEFTWVKKFMVSVLVAITDFWRFIQISM